MTRIYLVSLADDMYKQDIVIGVFSTRGKARDSIKETYGDVEEIVHNNSTSYYQVMPKESVWIFNIELDKEIGRDYD